LAERIDDVPSIIDGHAVLHIFRLKRVASAQDRRSGDQGVVDRKTVALRQRDDLLNRAGARYVEAGDTFDQVMAVGFASELEALAVLDGYEERALSKRKRMLQALAAAERANLAYERRVNVFLEPVARLDIAEVVRAALDQLPERNSGKASEEIYTGAFDLGSCGRVEAFVQWHDAASGSMSVRMSCNGQEIPKQVFTIVKTAAGIAGERWVAIRRRAGRSPIFMCGRPGAKQDLGTP
jgi:hypothetical protein